MNAEDLKDDVELEVQVEEEVPQEEPKPETEEVSGLEEQTKKPSKFQKRIDDLTHKQREAERQRDEYYKVAQKIMEENNSLRRTAQEFSSTSVNEMEARINTDLDSAKADFRKAYEDGDADKITEAQDKMIKASQQTSKLESMRTRAASDNYAEREPVTPPPDTKAVEWASRNQWFNRDMIMTNAAYAVHDEAISQGISLGSDNYYEVIDQRMREEFPQKFKEEVEDAPPPARKGNATSVVTPGGNETGRSKKVRLSPSQVAVANRLGVPLEEYAKQFVALEN